MVIRYFERIANKLNNNRVLKTSLYILILIILLVVGTYAVYITTKEGSVLNKLLMDSPEFKFTFTESNEVTLTNPINEQKQDFKFNIKATSNDQNYMFDIDYNIYLKVDNDNTIENEEVYVQLYDKENNKITDAIKVSDLQLKENKTNEYIISSKNIKLADEVISDNYILKYWYTDDINVEYTQTDDSQTATYKQENRIYNMTVNVEISSYKTGKLESIEITNPSRRAYQLEGQVFDTREMVIKANYTNDLEKEVTTYEVSPSTLTTSDEKVTISYGNQKVEHEIEVKPLSVTLVAGDVFSKKIKDLANNTTTATYSSEDNTVTYIGFYENELPEGISTKEELENLSNISVSNDNKTKAYNDNGKIYIYSDDEIIAGASMYSMFRGFKSLTEIDLAVLDTSNVTSMESTFYASSSLTSLDLTSFDTSNVVTMLRMFRTDEALTKLDLSSFDTSNVTDMSAMFYGCNSLTEVDVSGFDTGNVLDMGLMFFGMLSTISLDLSSFDTNNVTDMNYMFYDMNKLTDLKLGPNFKTDKVENMNHMFARMHKITELDLTTFNTSKVTNMTSMFANSELLTKINVSNKWVIGTSTTTTDMFLNCGTSSVTYVN